MVSVDTVAAVGATRVCTFPIRSTPRTARASPRATHRHPALRGACQHTPGDAGGGAGPEIPARPVLSLARVPARTATASFAPGRYPAAGGACHGAGLDEAWKGGAAGDARRRASTAAGRVAGHHPGTAAWPRARRSALEGRSPPSRPRSRRRSCRHSTDVTPEWGHARCRSHPPRWRARVRATLMHALQRAEGCIAGAGGAADRLGLTPTPLTSRLRALTINPQGAP